MSAYLHWTESEVLVLFLLPCLRHTGRVEYSLGHGMASRLMFDSDIAKALAFDKTNRARLFAVVSTDACRHSSNVAQIPAHSLRQ